VLLNYIVAISWSVLSPFLDKQLCCRKEPRDASCLSVVSFIASIVQYLERSFFIISYFGFGFTSAYNSILFCWLRRNVEPCCHTHDSRSTVYNARPRLVGLALWVIARGAWWSNTRIKQKAGRGCDIQPRCSSYWSRSQIIVGNRYFSYPTCILRPRKGGSRRNIAMPFGMEKLEWYGYPMVKKTLKMLKILKIRFDRMYERDTHTHTHRRTPHDG